MPVVIAATPRRQPGSGRRREAPSAATADTSGPSVECVSWKHRPGRSAAYATGAVLPRSTYAGDRA